MGCYYATLLRAFGEGAAPKHEEVMADIIEFGNQNEDGGELGQEDWVAALEEGGKRESE